MQYYKVLSQQAPVQTELNYKEYRSGKSIIDRDANQALQQSMYRVTPVQVSTWLYYVKTGLHDFKIIYESPSLW